MIPKHLLDTLILILWMGAIGFAFSGWGGAVRRWVNRPTHENSASNALRLTLTDIWLGVCVCITLTEFAHFFRPINWQVSLAVLGGGWLLTTWAWMRSISPFAAWPSPKFLVAWPRWIYVAGIVTVIGIWIAAAMMGASNYDSGLYHFGSIKWLNEHPITYGLVNLHTRFGYNQSYFALIALLNLHPFYEPAYAATGLFLFLLTAFSCAYFLSCTIPNRRLIWAGLVVLLSGFSLKTSSPSPDIAVALFQIVIFIVLFEILYNEHPLKRTATSDAKLLTSTRLTLLVILCVTAVTIKLSMLLFCLGAMLVSLRPLWSWLKTQPSAAFKLIALCSVMLVVHALRGIALSGLPFYPSTFAGIWNRPYTPDLTRVIAEANSIYSWARLPGVSPDIVLRSWDWLTPWAAALPARFWTLTLLSTALLLVNLALLIFSKQHRNNLKMYALYLPLVFGLTFWFLTAPDARFLGAIPELSIVLGSWLLWSTIWSLLKQRIQPAQQLRRFAIGLGVIVLVASAFYALKLRTGLGLAQHFYIGEILYGLSQIDINANFMLAFLTGIGLLSLQATQSTQNHTQRLSIASILQILLTILFASLVVKFVAGTAMLKVSTLQGWRAVPTEPYETIELKSGLKVNVPMSDDMCWTTPLPCIPRQQLNPNLKLESSSAAPLPTPEQRMFLLGH
jgi:hypothetical protein